MIERRIERLGEDEQAILGRGQRGRHGVLGGLGGGGAGADDGRGRGAVRRAGAAPTLHPLARSRASGRTGRWRRATGSSMRCIGTRSTRASRPRGGGELAPGDRRAGGGRPWRPGARCRRRARRALRAGARRSAGRPLSEAGGGDGESRRHANLEAVGYLGRALEIAERLPGRRARRPRASASSSSSGSPAAPWATCVPRSRTSRRAPVTRGSTAGPTRRCGHCCSWRGALSWIDRDREPGGGRAGARPGASPGRRGVGGSRPRFPRRSSASCCADGGTRTPRRVAARSRPCGARASRGI